MLTSINCLRRRRRQEMKSHDQEENTRERAATASGKMKE